MSVNDPHLIPSSAGPVQPYSQGQGSDWGGGRSDDTERPAANPLGRYMSAIWRFKWLVALFAILGVGAGLAAIRLIQPEYEVDASIAMQMGESSGGRTGPLQPDQLLNSTGWIDLLRSARVVDPIVEMLGLYVRPSVAADSVLLQSFQSDQQRLVPGQYTLSVSGDKYTLTKAPGQLVETGSVGDSVGRRVGFLWVPPFDALSQRKQIEFNVQTSRETSRLLLARFNVREPPVGSPFINTTLRGTNGAETAKILNAWVDQFVSVAAELKKDKVTRQATIYKGQLEYQRQSLANSEAALQRFRVNTVTKPSERQTMTAGITLTNTPVINEYFTRRAQAENLRRDREAIEAAIIEGKQSGIQPEALLSIPSIATDQAAFRLQTLLKEQLETESKVRIEGEKYLDEAPQMKTLLGRLALLKKEVIPASVQLYLTQIKLREKDLAVSLTENETSLKDMPVRTITEGALERTRDQDEALYKTLDKMTNEARLAEAATIPDVSVLVRAVAPLSPTKNTKPIIFGGVVAVAIALGLALAVLLDQLDKRFRYTAQATDDLGLFILGVVPVVNSSKRGGKTDQAAQVVEAFRTIRMNVRYAAEPGRPLTLTITSPGPNDGKSLISSNLALSFAEAGSRTLLIDGDIRRGELASTFGTQTRPGLVEYLDGTALIAEVLHPTTAHANLTVMPAGARRRRAPELLATTRLPQLINQLATEYDVIVVDSPPLGAGADAYALGTATGNMAVVLRTGLTDRKMAAAKLAILDTLPIRLMGAILNGIKLTGEYQYYAYYQDYAAEDEVPKPQRLTSGPASRPEAVSRAG